MKDTDSVLKMLQDIRAEIDKTYYSQGSGFDDYSFGFINCKDEDMQIIDKYINKIKSRSHECPSCGAAADSGHTYCVDCEGLNGLL